MGPIYSGAAVGANGAATANASSIHVISGRVIAVGLKYLDSPPAGTTDVVVSTGGQEGPALTILSLSNAATDGWFYPRTPTVTITGAAGAEEDLLAIADIVNVKIDQANAGDGVEVWLKME